MKSLLLGPIAVAVTYFLTTLMIWLGHYWPHRPDSMLRDFHLGGHHTHYPDSTHTRTTTFRFGHGRHDSLVPQLPWLIGLGASFWPLLPGPWALALTLEVILVAALFSYVHSQFHLTHSWLMRFSSFMQARSIHDVHHDLDVNFMVYDHFWDKVLGTYRAPPASASSKA